MRGRERSLWKRAVRRLKSSRASAYLEYAVVLPLVVLSISALIEFAAFWDAKIMANHAAWTCARIASVEAGVQDYPKKGFGEERLLTMGMKTATAMLMSTCVMGSMHGSSTDFVNDWFKTLIMDPINNLQGEITERVKNAFKSGTGVKNMMPSWAGSGNDPVKKLLDKLNFNVFDNIINKARDAILNSILDPLFDAIKEKVSDIFAPLLDKLKDAIDGNRALRQFAYAWSRVAKVKGIITVREREDLAFTYKKSGETIGVDTRIDFPRCLDNSAKCDNWFVRSDSPWPPNNQQQRMIDVTIRWPFERAWLFPVISSGKGAKVGSRPTAVGRALFYPQPAIKNEHLKSVGAEAFASAETNATKAIDKAKNQYMGFLKVAALYYHYQLGNEEVGPYDSDKNRGGTYKGIGVGISGWTDMEKIAKDDGLVFWSGRAPDDPRDQKAWERKTPPADYLKCFQSITGANNEKCGFWTKVDGDTKWKRFGEKLHLMEKKTGKTAALTSFEWHAYRAKEWFYWGDDLAQLERGRLRLKHSSILGSKYLTPDQGFLEARRQDIVKNWREKKMPWHKKIMFGLHELGQLLDKGVASSKDLRKAFLVEGRIGRAVTEKEYGATAKEREESSVTNVSYEVYRGLADRDSRLAPSVANMILARSDDSVWQGTTNTLYRECELLDLEAERILFDEIPTLHEATRTLMKTCSKELDKALESNLENNETSTNKVDSSNFFDLGGDSAEEVNATNAAKMVEKKLKELRPKVFAAVTKIDECEERLRNARKSFDESMKKLIDRRNQDVVEFAQLVGLTIMKHGGADDPDLVLKTLREEYSWEAERDARRRTPLNESLRFLVAALEVRKLFNDYYDAQVELAKLFNLKAARLSLNELANGVVPDIKELGRALPDPTLPEVSSDASGSDKDGTGDSWTYDSKDGWR